MKGIGESNWYEDWLPSCGTNTVERKKTTATNATTKTGSTERIDISVKYCFFCPSDREHQNNVARKDDVGRAPGATS